MKDKNQNRNQTENLISAPRGLLSLYFLQSGSKFQT